MDRQMYEYSMLDRVAPLEDDLPMCLVEKNACQPCRIYQAKQFGFLAAVMMYPTKTIQYYSRVLLRLLLTPVPQLCSFACTAVGLALQGDTNIVSEPSKATWKLSVPCI